MAEANMIKAKQMYARVVEAFGGKGWRYQEHEDDLRVDISFGTDDLPVEMRVRIYPKIEAICVTAPMSFKMPEDKRLDGAIAVCVANYGLICGGFDYDINDGEISIRLSLLYTDTDVSCEAITDMIGLTVSTSDNYNDKFFMLAKGMMTIEDFVAKENE